MYLFKDSSISIHLVTNRGGLQLGEVASDGTEWKKRLTDFGAGVQAENYNEFLFDYISPDYKTFEPNSLRIRCQLYLYNIKTTDCQSQSEYGNRDCPRSFGAYGMDNHDDHKADFYFPWIR